MKRAMNSVILSLAVFLGASICSASVLTVGPNGQYPTPCAAIAVANTGDTIQIDYNNGVPYAEPAHNGVDQTSDCVFTTNNLTIVGVNGRPILDATGENIAKGIFDVYGSGVTFTNLEMRGAATPAGGGSNAAGVRVESGTTAAPGGGDITIQYCYIHNNQDGVLTANVGASEGGAYASKNPFILFQYDEFAYNGAGDGESHNMYIGYDGNFATTFTLQYSWSHDSVVGHDLKSRAPINNLLYNIIDDQVGSSSYLLNFPLGGTAYIVGNVFYKNAVASAFSQLSNDTWMLYADRGDNTPSDPEYSPGNQDVHFVNNTVILDPSDGINNGGAFVTIGCQQTTDLTTCATPSNGPEVTTKAVVENNIFVGPSSVAIDQTNAQVANNDIINNRSSNNPTGLLTGLFNNWQYLDYHLIAGAGTPPILGGLYPPTLNDGVTADPKALAAYEYVVPTGSVARPAPASNATAMDDGAYSYPRVDSPPTPTLTYSPASQSVTTPGVITLTLTGLPTPAAGSYNVVAFESENTSLISSTSVTSSTGTVTATFSPNPTSGATVVPIDIYVDGAYLQASVTILPGAPALQSITQDAPGNGETTVHLTNAATSAVTVTLSSSNPSVVYVPSTVTIPVGSASVEVGSAIGSLWGPSPATQTATVTATALGRTVTLPVTVATPVARHFYCNIYSPGCQVIGGQQLNNMAAAEYSTNDWPIWGGPVTFTSDTPSVIPTQTFEVGGALVPGGPVQSAIGNSTTGGPGWYDTFVLNTNPVTVPTNVTLTLNINGSTRPPAVIQVLPPDGVGFAASISTVSGSGQTAADGVNFAQPLVAWVQDANGFAVQGAVVTFAGTGVNFPNGGTVNTDSSGLATITAQPASSGTLNITASVAGVGTPATFTETATAVPQTNIAVVSGSGQTTEVGTSFANPLVVVVTDSNGNGVPNVTVTFTGAGASFPSGATAVTTSNGQAQVVAQPTTGGALTITAAAAAVSTPATFSETGGSPFTLSLVAGPAAVLYGGAATFNLSLVNSGFAGVVNFTCVQTTAVAGVACNAPTSVTLTSSEASAPLTVTITAPASAQSQPPSLFRTALPLSYAVLVFVLFRRRKGIAKHLLLALAALAIFGMSACSGSTNATVPPPSQNAAFTLTATSGTQSTNVTLNLTINP